MASVKKPVKSSKTKQAKQPGTRNLKTKASKNSAELKAKKAAAARALAARKTASKAKTKSATAAKTRRKTLGEATAGANKTAAKKKSATLKTASARGSSKARRVATTGRGKATLVRASASKRAAPARSAAKSVKSARPASNATASAGKSTARTRAVALNKPAAVKGQGRGAGKPAVLQKVAESARQTGASTSSKTAAAISSAALKQNVARLTEARKRAAAATIARQPDISSTLSLELNDRTAVTKKPEKKISAESSFEAAKANFAKVAASNVTLQPAGKAAAKPAAGKTAAVAVAAPSIEARAAVAEPATPMIARANQTDIKPVVAPAKPAKTANPAKQLFKPNEFVVYPTHGVGQIIAIEEQEVAGFKLELFVISFIKDKMILKVPLPKVASVGMRKLADAGVVKTALDTLTGRARVKRTMWSRRAQEYEAKINSGDLNAIAEVVRDLYRSDAQPEQSYSERQLYEAALDRMAREIIVVQKLTETESLKIIEAQLQKGPRRGKSEELEAEEADIEEAA